MGQVHGAWLCTGGHEVLDPTARMCPECGRDVMWRDGGAQAPQAGPRSQADLAEGVLRQLLGGGVLVCLSGVVLSLVATAGLLPDDGSFGIGVPELVVLALAGLAVLAGVLLVLTGLVGYGVKAGPPGQPAGRPAGRGSWAVRG